MPDEGPRWDSVPWAPERAEEPRSFGHAAEQVFRSRDDADAEPEVREVRFSEMSARGVGLDISADCGEGGSQEPGRKGLAIEGYAEVMAGCGNLPFP